MTEKQAYYIHPATSRAVVLTREGRRVFVDRYAPAGPVRGHVRYGVLSRVSNFPRAAMRRAGRDLKADGYERSREPFPWLP